MISAIILAAGESKRMGQPKMLLPWGEVSVINMSLSVFEKAGIEEIIIVTGGVREKVEETVKDYPVRTIYNCEYANGEMLSSLQCGLEAITSQTQAVLIGLGDQPQVEERSVRSICERYRENKSSLIVPSYPNAARASLAGGAFTLGGNPGDEITRPPARLYEEARAGNRIHGNQFRQYPGRPGYAGRLSKIKAIQQHSMKRSLLYKIVSTTGQDMAQKSYAASTRRTSTKYRLMAL